MTVTALILVALLQVSVEAPARITNFEGRVEVGDAVVTHIGDLVVVGDRLHTLQRASLTLSMEPGLVLQLRSDTRLEMKSANGEPIALLTEGSVNVKSTGKPVRVETRYGQIIGSEGGQEFEVSYNGDVVQVLLSGGTVRAEVSDSSKVVFKNAYDFGARVYQAGSISSTAPQERSGTTVIVYPEVGNPARGVGPNRPNGKRPAPVTPPIPPK